jgi:hypothetical protein
MANQLAEEVKKAETPTGMSDTELRAALEAERNARADAERQASFYRGAAGAEYNRAEQATRAASARPADPLTDPFAKLAAEDPLLDPEKRARLLDEGSRSRAREEAIKIAREQDANRRMENQEMEARLALRMFQASHPEINSDTEGFAAAMTRAKIRSDNKNMRLDPMGMLELGMQVYNESKAPVQNAPYTEAPSGGGPGAPRSKEEEKPLSMAEELYGAPDFVDERKMPLDKYTEQFLDNRNLELVEKEKFWSGIRNVVGDIRAAKGRKSAGR